MMSSQPSTPTRSYYRQRTNTTTNTQQQSSSLSSDINNHNTNTNNQFRTSIVEEFQPYRDDPTTTMAPKLVSKTWGGYGPAVTTATNMNGDFNNNNSYNTPQSYDSNNNNNNHTSSTDNDDHDTDDIDPSKQQRYNRYFRNSRILLLLRPIWNSLIYCCRTTQHIFNDICTPQLPDIYNNTTNTNTDRTSSHPSKNNNSNNNNSTTITNGYNYYYYIDDFNDLSYSCSFGTSDTDGIWMNLHDPVGTIMMSIVWILFLYSIITISILAKQQTDAIMNTISEENNDNNESTDTTTLPKHIYFPIYYSMIYTLFATLALASHIKTSLTDPGSVPSSAVPTIQQQQQQNSQSHKKFSMCSQCQTYKPIGSHHCRICNRCICNMDHHCPWMNNCIGSGNLKHFILFLIYTWICCILQLSYFTYNYFFCIHPIYCVYNIVMTQLVRIMTLLSIGALLFTSSMIMNVIYGIMTGVGTIDRLKKKATNTFLDSDEDAIPLVHIFGMNPYYTWCLPCIDPIFPNYDIVMGYSTPQRLLREQMRTNSYTPFSGTTGTISGTTMENNIPFHHQHHHTTTPTVTSSIV